MSTSKVPAGMLIRLRSGGGPLHPIHGEGRHAAGDTVNYDQGVGYRDPDDDYMGLHRIEHAIAGDLIVATFHNGPAQLVKVEAVSA